MSKNKVIIIFKTTELLQIVVKLHYQGQNTRTKSYIARKTGNVTHIIHKLDDNGKLFDLQINRNYYIN